MTMEMSTLENKRVLTSCRGGPLTDDIYIEIPIKAGTVGYRLFNGTHQFGFHTSESESRGVLVFLKKDDVEELHNCWRRRFKGYHGKYHVVLSIDMIDITLVDDILKSDCIAGLIVLDPESRLDPSKRLSHDGACPNPTSGMHSGGCSSDNAWNERGYILYEGLRNIDWRMQILYMYNQTHLETIKQQDSFGLIPEVSPGEISVLTSVIAVLAAARGIGLHASAFEKAAEHSDRHESFDYIGSSDIEYTMGLGTFPEKIKNNSTAWIDPIAVSQLDGIVEIQQLGTGDGSKLNALIDGHQFQEGQLQDLLASLSAGASAAGGSLVHPTADSRVPPSSWYPFARVNPSVKGVVLAPFSDKYEYRRVNSMLDRASWTAKERSAAISEITLAASAVLRAAADYVHLDPVVKKSLTIDHKFVSDLTECFVGSEKWTDCSFFAKMEFDAEFLARKPYLGKSTYISAEATNTLRVFIAHALFYAIGSTADTSNITDEKSCAEFTKNQNDFHVYSYSWQADPYTGVYRCYRAPFRGYDFKNNTYSTWTESIYTIENLRLYLVQGESYEYSMLLIGIVFAVVSFLIVGRCNEDTFMIKREESRVEEETYVTNIGQSMELLTANARDEYLACFDKGIDAGKTEEQAKKACRSELRSFEGACPGSWVTHFIRKHNFERYKQTLVEEGVLWTSLRVRDQSTAASKPPRRRKSVVVNKVSPESAASSADPSTSSAPIRKQASKAKISRASLTVDPKNFPKLTVPPTAPPQNPLEKSNEKQPLFTPEPAANGREHWSLPSLVEAESVDTQPLLKFVDFSKSSIADDIPENINIHRLLASLRLCHKYKFGGQVIQARLTALTPPAVLEASRLLAEGEMRRRCALRTQSVEELDDVAGLASDLRDQLKRIHLPPSMSVTINALLGCVIDPSHTVSTFSPNAFKLPVYRHEVHLHLACAALESEQWPMFKLIMQSCPLSPHYSPVLVFHIIDFAVRNPKSKMSFQLVRDCIVQEKRRDVMEWYLDAASQERLPLNQLQWSKYASNLISVCGSKADPISVTKQGGLSTAAGKSLPISVPVEEPISESDFQSLKADLNSLLHELSKRSGSVTKKEVAALRQNLRSWAKKDEKAVIIDSLNVYHGFQRGFEPLVKLTTRLADEYENAIVVTRHFLADKLKSVRWRGNSLTWVTNIYASRSEDDLLVLLAAMEWGRNAYVLSNDRFTTVFVCHHIIEINDIVAVISLV
ncbi:Nicastrin [Ancylostoma ceylanicum]|uniref:Nicastrin n=1 Tax=Ancylostoma ceylanicum TaxID=53326 RepID=A0A0D6MA87_9BILA|nr:Nicastrin [Ancylostoma ceylanicum]